jgi:hypothetical protein
MLLLTSAAVKLPKSLWPFMPPPVMKSAAFQKSLGIAYLTSFASKNKGAGCLTVLIIGVLVEKLLLMCFGGRLWRKCHFMSRITEGWNPEPACPVSADAPFTKPTSELHLRTSKKRLFVTSYYRDVLSYNQIAQLSC